jgi:hypothetical protein
MGTAWSSQPTGQFPLSPSEVSMVIFGMVIEVEFVQNDLITL